jgi:hypothetical protein
MNRSRYHTKTCATLEMFKAFTWTIIPRFLATVRLSFPRRTPIVPVNIERDAFHHASELVLGLDDCNRWTLDETNSYVRFPFGQCSIALRVMILVFRGAGLPWGRCTLPSSRFDKASP